MKRLGARGRGAELIAALMKGPRTIPELLDVIGNTYTGAHGGVRAWLEELRASGVVRIAGKRRTTRRLATVWAMQRELFGEPDQPEVIL